MEISILMLTYNHERYIRQALDSILRQEINVSFEILVLDDASTDGTQGILKEYKKKFPHLISLYLRKKNVYHPTKNGYFLTSKAIGKYIAILEGDDYWIDPLKLQKQYDFLEKYKEFSACMTDLKIVDEDDKEICGMQVFNKKKDQIYTLKDFSYLRMPGMVVTMMARNYFNENEYAIMMKASRNMGDITRFMLLVMKGNIYQIDEKTAAYRYVSISGKNNFNSINKENKYKDYTCLQYWIRLENYVRKYYDKNFRIIPIREWLFFNSDKYMTKSILRLIFESDKRKEYLSMFLIYKYMMDSCFIQSNPVKVNHKWREFIGIKQPVVLFGAGAVAEEYLDKYGWKGNILFIVDNDKNKQNTSYKGYLIKHPDEILKYKSKVHILITNKNNERSIGEQLDSMGVSQYYCYCAMQSKRFRNAISVRLLHILFDRSEINELKSNKVEEKRKNVWKTK